MSRILCNSLLTVVSLHCFDTVGWWEGHLACRITEQWSASDDDLTGAWHVLVFQLSVPPPPSLLLQQNPVRSDILVPACPGGRGMLAVELMLL